MVCLASCLPKRYIFYCLVSFPHNDMRLPNLSALRAFEAAVRHENFSRAAAELCLTHGAISHKVRGLEEELGVQLFVRNGKQVTATPEARRYAATVARCLSELADGAAELRPPDGVQRLSVTAIPSFAARWLAPRLGQFIEQHPTIEVILQASGQLQGLVRGGDRCRHPLRARQVSRAGCRAPDRRDLLSGSESSLSRWTTARLSTGLGKGHVAALERTLGTLVPGSRTGLAGAFRRRDVRRLVNADTLGRRWRRGGIGAPRGGDAGNCVGPAGAAIRYRLALPG